LAKQPTPTRFLVLGNPFGAHPDFFFPKDFGRDIALSKTLKSLDWVKDRLTVLSHTDHNMVSGHGREVSFLSGVLPADAVAYPEKNMSLDQLMARHVGSLTAHTKDPTCASCHQTIDPWGYAFENFDPTGAWRDGYHAALSDASVDGAAKRPKKGRRASTIPIDASATFRNGRSYESITDYRQQVLTEANRDRFVRCFITKLLTYANGAEPGRADFAAIDGILAESAKADYRIVDTIAAVIHSPLFRDRKH
jgi:hypothetical protein